MNSPEQSGFHTVSVCSVTPSGERQSKRALPVESPIAVSFNGIAYAVMMATPMDLEDFGIGFTLSERIATSPQDIHDVTPVKTDDGWLLLVNVSERCMANVHLRVRNRIGEGSCGLCGLENLAEVNRPLPKITTRLQLEAPVIFTAINHLRDHQPLNNLTGGAHAAAACAPESGDILLAREDVGRHNALDKLIGALVRTRRAPQDFFFIVSSRCSYELVEKCAIAGCPLLVTISTATSLAMQKAQDCGLQLISLARSDGYLINNGSIT